MTSFVVSLRLIISLCGLFVSGMFQAFFPRCGAVCPPQLPLSCTGGEYPCCFVCALYKCDRFLTYIKVIYNSHCCCSYENVESFKPWWGIILHLVSRSRVVQSQCGVLLDPSSTIPAQGLVAGNENRPTLVSWYSSEGWWLVYIRVSRIRPT